MKYAENMCHRESCNEKVKTTPNRCNGCFNLKSNHLVPIYLRILIYKFHNKKEINAYVNIA